MLLGARHRGRMAAAIAGGIAVLAALTWLVFGGHLPDVTDQDKLVNVLGIPNVFGYAIGLGGLTNPLKLALEGGALISVLVASAFAYRRRETWLACSGWVTLIVLLTLAWVMPWYVMWLIPFAALARRRALIVAVVAITLFQSPLTPWVVHRAGIGIDQTPLAKWRIGYVHRLLH
jgi:alpha-1,6-mannosyltransferase